MKPEWLNRALIVGPYFTLCLSEAAYHAECARLKWQPDAWITSETANATTHHGVNEDGEPACIVCLKGAEAHEPISVASLLVHEAVHVWQRWCDHVGEHTPGHETEAYAVQWLSQQLMYEFVRQTGGAK